MHAGAQRPRPGNSVSTLPRMGIDPIQPLCPAKLAAAEHFKRPILKNVLAGFAVDGLGKSLVTGVQTGTEFGLQRANQGGEPSPGKVGFLPCKLGAGHHRLGVAPSALAFGQGPWGAALGRFRALLRVLPRVLRRVLRRVLLRALLRVSPEVQPRLVYRALGNARRARSQVGVRPVRRMHALAEVRVEVQRPGPKHLPGRCCRMPLLPGNPTVQREDFNRESLPAQGNGSKMNLTPENMKVPGLPRRGLVTMEKRVTSRGLIRPGDRRKVQLVVVETSILCRIKGTEQTEYSAARVLCAERCFKCGPAPDGTAHPPESCGGCCRSIDLQHPEPG